MIASLGGGNLMLLGNLKKVWVIQGLYIWEYEGNNMNEPPLLYLFTTIYHICILNVSED